jgi:uncharacterized membrane protein
MNSRWRPIALWALETLVLAAGFHYAAVGMYPRAKMSYVEGKMLKRSEKNTLYHGSPPTPKDRVVVLPSPDLIYSSGVFDVSEAPLRITAPRTGSYMSLSLYASNSDNFFVLNDHQIEGEGFDTVLAGPTAPDPGIKGARLVRAPSLTGIILLRYFAGEGTRGEEIASRQQQVTCTPIR